MPATATVPMYFVLWFRPRKGKPWEMRSTHATEQEAYGAMQGWGEFIILEAGREP